MYVNHIKFISIKCIVSDLVLAVVGLLATVRPLCEFLSEGGLRRLLHFASCSWSIPRNVKLVLELWHTQSLWKCLCFPLVASASQFSHRNLFAFGKCFGDRNAVFCNKGLIALCTPLLFHSALRVVSPFSYANAWDDKAGCSCLSLVHHTC